MQNTLASLPTTQKVIFLVALVLITSSIVYRFKNVVESNDEYILRSPPLFHPSDSASAGPTTRVASAADKNKGFERSEERFGKQRGGGAPPPMPSAREWDALAALNNDPIPSAFSSLFRTTTSTVHNNNPSQNIPQRKLDSSSNQKNNESSSKIGKIALCFFGLVKSVDPVQLIAYDEAIVKPLRDAGYELEAFLHTFSMREFRNAANRGERRAHFNQTASIEALQSILPELKTVWLDDADDADAFFGRPRDYIKNGDPWPFNPLQSVLYYLRQQYSLLRVTEMWTGVATLPRRNDDQSTTTEKPQQGKEETSKKGSRPPRPVHGTTLRDLHDVGARLFSPQTSLPSLSRYKAVIYLRPDVMFRSQINIDALAALSLTDTEVQDEKRKRASNSVDEQTYASSRRNIRRVAVPTFEHHGFNDRFAFGTPQGMRLYGLRGLALQRYVEHSMPHAERYVRDFLCHADIESHLVPLIFSRRRSGGIDQDGTVHEELSQLLFDRVPRWGEVQAASLLVDERGVESSEVHEGGAVWRKCGLQSFWSVVPLRNSMSQASVVGIKREEMDESRGDSVSGKRPDGVQRGKELVVRLSGAREDTYKYPHSLQSVRTDTIVFVVGVMTLLVACGVRLKWEWRSGRKRFFGSSPFLA